MLSSISKRRGWLYSLINFGNSLTMRAFSAYALYHYVDVRHLPTAWASAVLTAFGFLSALGSPLMGYLSDTTRSPLGRRIPYIRYTVLPLAISFVLLWTTPFEGERSSWLLMLYFSAVAALWQFLYMAFTTCYFALLPEMFASYEKRAEVSAKMNATHTLGLLGGMALPPLVYGHLGWPAMGLIFGLLGGVAWSLGIQALFERPLRKELPLNLGPALRATLANRAFVAVVSAQTARYFATGVMAAGMAFYTKYSLQALEGTTSLLFLLVFGTAMLFLPLWRWVSRRTGPRAPLMVACAATGLFALLLGIARSVLQAAVVATGVGIALSGLFLMGDVILCDVIDEDQVRTGRRREGMYYGMSGFITSLSSSLTAATLGLVTSLYGYDSALAVQPPTVATGFRVLMSLLPFSSMMLAILALVFYPLHGSRLRALRARLKKSSAGWLAGGPAAEDSEDAG